MTVDPVDRDQVHAAHRPFIAFNSPIAHEFDFTPSMSIFVTCDTQTKSMNCSAN